MAQGAFPSAGGAHQGQGFPRRNMQAHMGQHPHVVVNAAGGINGDNVGDYADTRCDVLVTSWPYFGRPADIKMSFSPANPKP